MFYLAGFLCLWCCIFKIFFKIFVFMMFYLKDFCVYDVLSLRIFVFNVYDVLSLSYTWPCASGTLLECKLQYTRTLQKSPQGTRKHGIVYLVRLYLCNELLLFVFISDESLHPGISGRASVETIIYQARCIYYQNNWYFCPPPFFSKIIFFPQSTVKKSLSPYFPYLFAFFLINHNINIFSPTYRNLKMKNIYPCIKQQKIHGKEL